MNTIGSYLCNCSTGYQLNPDGRTCDGMIVVVLTNVKIEVFLYIHIHTDINECTEDTDGCAQICTNTVGNYTCSCQSGYRLAADRHWCAGESHDTPIN